MLLLNGKPVNYFKFSGGEIQVKIPKELELVNNLTWKPKSSDDIMLLIMTVSALNEEGYHDIELDCLYLPYARQDRVCQKGEANACFMMCAILESLKLSIIRFYDVHNCNRTFAHFYQTQVINVEVHDIFTHYKILNNFNSDETLLLAPDDGAFNRVQKVHLSNAQFNWDFCEKKRDSSTGIIIYDEIPEIVHKQVLVIDDICDGGATFNLLAQQSELNNLEGLYLYVTTGIFSKGLEELKQHYTHIYCHHVLDDTQYQSNEFLTILRPEVCLLTLYSQ